MRPLKPLGSDSTKGALYNACHLGSGMLSSTAQGPGALAHYFKLKFRTVFPKVCRQVAVVLVGFIPSQRARTEVKMTVRDRPVN